MSTPSWLAARLTTPCVIHNRIEAGTDEYGNVMYGDVATDTFCFIQPAGQTEIEDGRAVVGSFLVHLAASAAIDMDGFSSIDVDGATYEVLGPPAVYPSLTQPGANHVEAVVVRGSA